MARKADDVGDRRKIGPSSSFCASHWRSSSRRTLKGDWTEDGDGPSYLFRCSAPADDQHTGEDNSSDRQSLLIITRAPTPPPATPTGRHRRRRESVTGSCETAMTTRSRAASQTRFPTQQPTSRRSSITRTAYNTVLVTPKAETTSRMARPIKQLHCRPQYVHVYTEDDDEDDKRSDSWRSDSRHDLRSTPLSRHTPPSDTSASESDTNVTSSCDDDSEPLNSSEHVGARRAWPRKHITGAPHLRGREEPELLVPKTRERYIHTRGKVTRARPAVFREYASHKQEKRGEPKIDIITEEASDCADAEDDRIGLKPSRMREQSHLRRRKYIVYEDKTRRSSSRHPISRIERRSQSRHSSRTYRRVLVPRLEHSSDDHGAMSKTKRSSKKSHESQVISSKPPSSLRGSHTTSSSHATRSQSLRSMGSSRRSSFFGLWGPSHHMLTVEKRVQLVQCNACLEDTPDDKTPKLKCGHRMCHSCLKRIFKLSTTDPQSMPPKCCGSEFIPLKHVEKLFKDDFKRQWNAKYHEYSTRNRVYCASRKCGRWIRPANIYRENGRKVARCDRCKTRMCCSCRNKWHGARPCPTDVETLHFLEQAKREGWQQCHRCKAMVELKEGCNHMTCRCGAEFCMICGSKWKNCDCPWFHCGDEETDEMASFLMPAHFFSDHITQDRLDSRPPEYIRPGRPPMWLLAHSRPHVYQDEVLLHLLQEQQDGDLVRRLQVLGDLNDGDEEDDDRMGDVRDLVASGSHTDHVMSEDYRPAPLGQSFELPQLPVAPPGPGPLNPRGLVNPSADYLSSIHRARGKHETSQERRLADQFTPLARPVQNRLQSPPPSSSRPMVVILPPHSRANANTHTHVPAPDPHPHSYPPPTMHAPPMPPHHPAWARRAASPPLSVPHSPSMAVPLSMPPAVPQPPSAVPPSRTASSSSRTQEFCGSAAVPQANVSGTTARVSERKRDSHRERHEHHHRRHERRTRERKRGRRISESEEPKSSVLAGLSGPGRGMHRVDEWRAHIGSGAPAPPLSELMSVFS